MASGQDDNESYVSLDGGDPAQPLQILKLVSKMHIYISAHFGSLYPLNNLEVPEISNEKILIDHIKEDYDTVKGTTEFLSVPTGWIVTGDFAGDGRGDIVWRSNNDALSSWIGTTDSVFTGNEATHAANIPTNWKVVGTGNFNGDGRDDILWRSDNDALSSWFGAIDNLFAGNGTNSEANVPTNWKVAGTDNFSRNEQKDVLGYNHNGSAE